MPDFPLLSSLALAAALLLPAPASAAAVAGPLVTGCKTPGEAAIVLNKGLFPALKVRCSTQHITPHLKTLAETLARRGDPRLAFTAMLPVSTEGTP